MRVSVSEAKGQLTELVKRAEAGDEVILTRRGHEIVRLVAIAAAPGRKGRRALMEKVRAAAATKALPGPDAARSQDFLYDGDRTGRWIADFRRDRGRSSHRRHAA